MSKKKEAREPLRHAFSLSTNVGLVNFALLQHGRTFQVERMAREDAPDLNVGFRSIGSGVENLDTTSEAYDVFGISTRVRIDGAILGVSEMRAFDVDVLRAVLKKTKFCSWDHEAI